MCTKTVVVVWHVLICLCDKILRMSDDMHIVVNVYIMHGIAFGAVANSHGEELVSESLWICC